MVLVKTQHTEVSFDLALKPSPQEPRRPRFSFCLQLSNSVASPKSRQKPARRTGQSPSVLRKRRRRRRSAAPPSRWPVYRREPFLLSTPILKVFRQKVVFDRYQWLSEMRLLAATVTVARPGGSPPEAQETEPGLRTPRRQRPMRGRAQPFHPPAPRSGSRSSPPPRRSAAPVPDAEQSPTPATAAGHARHPAVAGPNAPCPP